MSNPLISVIVPIYNVEKYLDDTIQSVLNQSISFTHNIELILIDDGSTDESASIVMSYASEYQNIIYKRIENSGVSRARNFGLTLARGKYVHFFDSDDLITKDFYEKTTKFLDSHPNEIDFVATKISFFDAIIDEHPLNNKFHATRVIDLAMEQDVPILHAVTCVYRRSTISNMQFDESITISEDLKFLTELLRAKKKYGVIKGPTYYYRKRSGGGSALNGKEYDKKYYLYTPDRVYRPLLELYEYNSPYRLAMEYTLLYDISYRLSQKDQSILTDNEVSTYKNTILSIVSSCHDEVIAKHRFLTIHQKLYILKKKYGDTLNKKLKLEDNVLYIDTHTLYEYGRIKVYLDFLTQENSGNYTVEGYIDAPLILDVSLGVLASGDLTEAKPVERFQRREAFLGDVYYDGGAFRASFVWRTGKKLSFRLSGSGINQSPVIVTRQFTRLGRLWSAYRVDIGRLIKGGRSLRAYRYSWYGHIYLEARLLFGILMNWNLGAGWRQLMKLRRRNIDQLDLKRKIFEMAKPILFIVEAMVFIPRAFVLRLGFYLGKMLKKRPIWIVSDRGMAAGDNGEALFRYIRTLNDCPADVYFAISNKSSDYKRLGSIGRVLNYGSLRYKQKFLLADKIISSHADIEVTNPFLRQVDHYVDLYNSDFVFLQHGIIRNDLSDWLNRFEKNISLFITSAKKEYESIFKYPYYYDKDRVLLSGMPRYDYLENDPRNKIILAPTYRNGLLRLKTDKHGTRRYDDQFKNSDYFQFYDNFINNPEVLNVMKKAGMTGEVYIHPNFAPQLKDFHGNDVFRIMDYPYDYKKAIGEGSLLISDHSSVVLDFAYLYKPVIYSQFDAERFFNEQPYNRGDFFNDKKDGFGPVERSFDGLIHRVVFLVQNHCKMETVYIRRAKDFFAYHDKKNSQRVYEAIVAGVYNNKE